MNSWISIIVFNLDSVTTECCIEKYACCMEPGVVLETCLNSNTFKMNFPKGKCFLKVSSKHGTTRFKKIASMFYCCLSKTGKYGKPEIHKQKQPNKVKI